MGASFLQKIKELVKRDTSDSMQGVQQSAAIVQANKESAATHQGTYVARSLVDVDAYMSTLSTDPLSSIADVADAPTGIGQQVLVRLEDGTTVTYAQASAADIDIAEAELLMTDTAFSMLAAKSEEESWGVSSSIYLNGLHRLKQEVGTDTGYVSELNLGSSGVVNPTAATRIVADKSTYQIAPAYYAPLIKRPEGDPFLFDVVRYDHTTDSFVRDSLATATGYRINSLLLNANPTSLNIASAKIINRVPTMSAWVEEHWGEELESIMFEGTSFGMITEDSGYHISGRHASNAFKELRHLSAIFMSNGLEYTRSFDTVRDDRTVRTSTINENKIRYKDITLGKIPREGKEKENRVDFYGHPRAGLPSVRKYIRITADSFSTIGYFDSFDVTEDANSPLLLSYSVSFISEKTIWRG